MCMTAAVRSEAVRSTTTAVQQLLCDGDDVVHSISSSSSSSRRAHCYTALLLGELPPQQPTVTP
jgi:hypothetical protein